MNQPPQEEFIADVSLNTQTGEITTRHPVMLAYLIHSKVMQYNQVIPALSEGLKKDVLFHLTNYRKGCEIFITTGTPQCRAHRLPTDPCPYA